MKGAVEKKATVGNEVAVGKEAAVATETVSVTERLLIRKLRASDWRAMKRITSDFSKSKYAVYDHPFPESDEEMQALTQHFAEVGLWYAVCLKDSEEMIGYVCFHVNDGKYDIGYSFHSAYQGQGYAYESCKALVEYMREEYQAAVFTAGTALANAPSCRLLARLGFRLQTTESVSFHKDAEGKDITFIGGSFEWNPCAQIGHDIMTFMRGKYKLNEVGDGKDELKFKQGAKTILTVYKREDYYTFLVIFGAKERAIFDEQRGNFTEWLCEQYDAARTYHDGKWMYIDVHSIEQMEEIKKLVMIKKKPNRKAFAKENAVLGQCGHRCDLCIHYIGLTEEQRTKMLPHLDAMWGVDSDWSMRCGGCESATCYCKEDPCIQKKCAASIGAAKCSECDFYPCMQATVADCRSEVHTESYTAEDVTWGILPYVAGQYE